MDKTIFDFLPKDFGKDACGQCPTIIDEDGEEYLDYENACAGCRKRYDDLLDAVKKRMDWGYTSALAALDGEAP